MKRIGIVDSFVGGAMIGIGGLVISVISDQVFDVKLLWEKQSIKNAVKTIFVMGISGVVIIKGTNKLVELYGLKIKKYS